jgi:hypothetical protein
MRHVTQFTPGIEACNVCRPLVLRATEGWIDEDGMMKDSEFEAYLAEPIIRAARGKSRERVETALQPYFDLKRRPVKRRRR